MFDIIHGATTVSTEKSLHANRAVSKAVSIATVPAQDGGGFDAVTSVGAAHSVVTGNEGCTTPSVFPVWAELRFCDREQRRMSAG